MCPVSRSVKIPCHALLQMDVLSAYAHYGSCLTLPIYAAQCAQSAPYVSVILEFPLKGKSAVSA